METIKHIFRVNRRDISYLRWTIESYDGMAVVRTLNPHAAFIEIMISPGCEDLVLELLDSLRKEGLSLVGANSCCVLFS
ncbi:MAG: DUF4911 domain-containing protein [Deltaproteobacteria bacterium]|nr:DUF4911 domain-containing protein [Deltaproteobacteria bacterium]